jgi:hypothetical protein
MFGTVPSHASHTLAHHPRTSIFSLVRIATVCVVAVLCDFTWPPTLSLCHACPARVFFWHDDISLTVQFFAAHSQPLTHAPSLAARRPRSRCRSRDNAESDEDGGYVSPDTAAPQSPVDLAGCDRHSAVVVVSPRPPIMPSAHLWTLTPNCQTTTTTVAAAAAFAAPLGGEF